MLAELPAAVHFTVWSIALPLGAALITFATPRHAVRLGVAGAIATAGMSLAGVAKVAASGTQYHAVGGWGAPLGIELAADGFSALLLAITAVIGLAVSVYAVSYFASKPGRDAFWPLWLLLWTALNALFQSGDIFNLYVALELLGLTAAALVALTGTGPALIGAVRYLLVSLFGSVSFLVGVALLYHAYGTLDLDLLGERRGDGLPLAVPLAAMIAGMLLKTGLFPFHVWLPAAHGSARAPVSALLSALVVTATFYVLVRLWFTFGPAEQPVAVLLGTLGSIAVFWGALQALRQRRIKMLVAYSTAAQLGYLFLAFPLASGEPALSWGGSIYLALSHALAKAAMFLAAGSIMTEEGHDDIDGLDRIVDRMPVTMAAFALAGISLAGLPPSGGFVGKWMLLQAAISQGMWHWAMVLIAGGVLTAAYVFRVVGFSFTESSHVHEENAVPKTLEWTALLLALAAVSLGFVAPWALPLLDGVLP